MRFAPRRRRTFALLTLATWMFALFAGVAHACTTSPPAPAQAGAQAATAASHHGARGMEAGDAGIQPQHDPAASDCVKFCNEDTPLFAKVRLVQDQPAGHFVLAVAGSFMVAASPVGPDTTGLHVHPPPDVPLYLRSLRLAL